VAGAGVPRLIGNALELLFAGNELAGLVVEQELMAAGATLTAVHAEFPGGLPPWFVHPGDVGSERQLRALGSAQAGRVPFLPPPEAVTVVLALVAGGAVSGEGPSVAAAFASALRRCAARRGATGG
jgi:hypothetical protein